MLILQGSLAAMVFNNMANNRNKKYFFLFKQNKGSRQSFLNVAYIAWMLISNLDYMIGVSLLQGPQFKPELWLLEMNEWTIKYGCNPHDQPSCSGKMYYIFILTFIPMSDLYLYVNTRRTCTETPNLTQRVTSVRIRIFLSFFLLVTVREYFMPHFFFK